MDKYGNMTRKEACFFLGIKENASDEQIKRAYHYKAKLYHPDANPNTDTKEYYIKVQKAYEYLMTHPYSAVKNNSNVPIYGNVNNQMSPYGMNNQYYQNSANVRPAKVYATNASTRASYKRQKDKEKEIEKLQKWDEEYKSNKKKQQQMELYGRKYIDSLYEESRSTEEIVLEKIRAIWLAETIKRQIAADKEHKEALQRRKIYQAFMQQEMQDDNKGN